MKGYRYNYFKSYIYLHYLIDMNLCKNFILLNVLYGRVRYRGSWERCSQDTDLTSPLTHIALKSTKSLKFHETSFRGRLRELNSCTKRFTAFEFTVFKLYGNCWSVIFLAIQNGSLFLRCLILKCF